MIGEFSQFLKRILAAHHGVILLALALTILIEMPIFMFPFEARDNYRGINIVHFGTDEHYYLTRAKEVLEGHGLGNIVLSDGKNGQEPQFTYVEYALLLPVRLLGLADKVDVATLYNAYNFSGIFILILLIYYFILQISGGNKLLAITSALFVVGGYSIIYNKTIGSPEQNIYGRAVFPYLSSVAFFAFLNLLVQSLRTDGYKYAWFAGLSFASLFYIFFYSWSFVSAFLAVLLCLYLLDKDFVKLKKVALVFGLGLALGMYNFIKLLVFYGSEHGKQLGYFLWAVYSRAPIFSKIGFLMLLFLPVFFYFKRKDGNIIIFLAMIISGWLALNQQIVTGRLVQYGHYYWFFIVPLSIIMACYMAWELIGRAWIKKAVFILLIIIVFVNTGVGQYRITRAMAPLQLQDQKYAEIIKVLNDDSKDGTVLAADDAMEFLATIYTGHDLFWSGAALVFNTTMERAKDALFVYSYLNRDSRAIFPEYFNRIINNKDFSSTYKDLYMALEGYTSGLSYFDYANKAYDAAVIGEHRRSTIASLAGEYRVVSKSKIGILNLLKKYDVRYVIWDAKRYPEWDLEFLDNLEPLVSSDGIILYRINWSNS